MDSVFFEFDNSRGEILIKTKSKINKNNKSDEITSVALVWTHTHTSMKIYEFICSYKESVLCGQTLQ